MILDPEFVVDRRQHFSFLWVAIVIVLDLGEVVFTPGANPISYVPMTQVAQCYLHL